MCGCAFYGIWSNDHHEQVVWGGGGRRAAFKQITVASVFSLEDTVEV